MSLLFGRVFLQLTHYVAISIYIVWFFIAFSLFYFCTYHSFSTTAERQFISWLTTTNIHEIGKHASDTWSIYFVFCGSDLFWMQRIARQPGRTSSRSAVSGRDTPRGLRCGALSLPLPGRGCNFCWSGRRRLLRHAMTFSFHSCIFLMLFVWSAVVVWVVW